MSKKPEIGSVFPMAADESVGLLSDNKLAVREAMRLRFGHDGTIAIAGCTGGAWGLNVPESVTIETIQSISETMLHMSNRLNLWIGDLLAAAERLNYGDITAWASKLGYNVKTLSNWKFVCQSVPISLREEVHLFYPDMKPLTMGHYNLIAGMDELEQRFYITQCLIKGWSVATLYGAIHGRRSKRTHLERMKPYLTRIEETIHHAPDAERHMMLRAIRQWVDAVEESLDG